MKEIFEEYGGPIITVIVIIALIAIVAFLIGGVGDDGKLTGIVGQQISQMLDGLFSKTGI